MPLFATPAAAALPRRIRSAGVSASRSQSRRRRALLQLAERDGCVQVALRTVEGVTPQGADVLDLLESLNTAGALRWGGLRNERGSTVATYLKV